MCITNLTSFGYSSLWNTFEIPLLSTNIFSFFRYNNRVKNKRRASNIKKILLGCVILVFIFVVFNFINNWSAQTFALANKKPVSHSDLIDTKISQYSDNHITENAKAINPEFKNIAFAENIPTESSFWGNQIATVIKAVKSFTALPTKKESTKEYGSWVWTPIMTMSPAYMESILSGAKLDGVNTMYISIDTYLDIFVMPKGSEREKQKKAYSDKLEDFIVRANKKGIAVDAEAGWRNWAEDDNVYKALAVVNYVKNFNTANQNKFRGFQYDIEPYLLDSYEKNKESVLKDFVKLVDQTENFIGADPLHFSVVVPDFYDEKDGMTPKFAYNGQTDYTFTHLLNILDKKQNSSIIIMSYRNFADGKNGTIEISNNEMQTANNGAYNTKIIIAQETGNVPPPYITFNNTSKKYFDGQIDSINSAFKPYYNFGGIAVHYVNAFLALK